MVIFPVLLSIRATRPLVAASGAICHFADEAAVVTAVALSGEPTVVKLPVHNPSSLKVTLVIPSATGRITLPLALMKLRS